MDKSKIKDKAKNHVFVNCKKCRAKFKCESNDSNRDCWCNNLPNIMPMSRDTATPEDCYCPTCLEKIIHLELKNNKI